MLMESWKLLTWMWMVVFTFNKVIVTDKHTDLNMNVDINQQIIKIFFSLSETKNEIRPTPLFQLRKKCKWTYIVYVFEVKAWIYLEIGERSSSSILRKTNSELQAGIEPATFWWPVRRSNHFELPRLRWWAKVQVSHAWCIHVLFQQVQAFEHGIKTRESKWSYCFREFCVRG